jgi:hypothetical protein
MGDKGVELHHILMRRQCMACWEDGLLAGLDGGPYTSMLKLTNVVYWDQRRMP